MLHLFGCITKLPERLRAAMGCWLKALGEEAFGMLTVVVQVMRRGLQPQWLTAAIIPVGGPYCSCKLRDMLGRGSCRLTSACGASSTKPPVLC